MRKGCFVLKPQVSLRRRCASHPCSSQNDIPDLACLPWGRTFPGQGWPLRKAPKVQLLERFLTSISQKQMEILSATGSQQESK